MAQRRPAELLPRERALAGRKGHGVAGGESHGLSRAGWVTLLGCLLRLGVCPPPQEPKEAARAGLPVLLILVRDGPLWGLHRREAMTRLPEASSGSETLLASRGLVCRA